MLVDLIFPKYIPKRWETDGPNRGAIARAVFTVTYCISTQKRSRKKLQKSSESIFNVLVVYLYGKIAWMVIILLLWWSTGRFGVFLSPMLLESKIRFLWSQFFSGSAFKSPVLIRQNCTKWIRECNFSKNLPISSSTVDYHLPGFMIVFVVLERASLVSPVFAPHIAMISFEPHLQFHFYLQALLQSCGWLSSTIFIIYNRAENEFKVAVLQLTTMYEYVEFKIYLQGQMFA